MCFPTKHMSKVAEKEISEPPEGQEGCEGELRPLYSLS